MRRRRARDWICLNAYHQKHDAAAAAAVVVVVVVEVVYTFSFRVFTPARIRLFRSDWAVIL